MRKTLALLGLSLALAAAPLAAQAALGQWQGDLEAAKAQARELGVPLLVIWGTPTCPKCKKFDEQLAEAEAQAYLAGRGIALYREKAPAKPATAAKEWVGEGKYPLLRVTWERDGVSLADFRWSRPASFAEFRETLEGQIGGYRPAP
jgi:hypothetical protein